MTKDLVIIALGIWVALVPFLGFPNSWDKIIFTISGLSVCVLMFLLRRDFFNYVERLRKRTRRERAPSTYVENELHGELELVEEGTHRRRKFHIDGTQETENGETTRQSKARS